MTEVVLKYCFDLLVLIDVRRERRGKTNSQIFVRLFENSLFLRLKRVALGVLKISIVGDAQPSPHLFTPRATSASRRLTLSRLFSKIFARVRDGGKRAFDSPSRSTSAWNASHASRGITRHHFPLSTPPPTPRVELMVF